MRTTIDLPEDLLRRAKAEAALRGERLKDLVSEAVRRFLLDCARGPQSAGVDIGEQQLSPHCVFPIITGATGPAMPRLKGSEAQRLLDEEDLDRAIRSR